MRVVLEIAGWLLLLQGAGGVINTLFGWWSWAHDLLLVNKLSILSGYEVFASIFLGVLGAALLAATSAAKKREA
ncbi:hypothetical protein ACIBKY_39760 [Nonomuraea sp. NPDC050394]|uniref:hypothetical protein n=1 Tax=Nonomuraea sp. NPDC050394 TaxID=3364363 RepID=UPI0037A6E677